MQHTVFSLLTKFNVHGPIVVRLRPRCRDEPLSKTIDRGKITLQLTKYNNNNIPYSKINSSCFLLTVL